MNVVFAVMQICYAAAVWARQPILASSRPMSSSALAENANSIANFHDDWGRIFFLGISRQHRPPGISGGRRMAADLVAAEEGAQPLDGEHAADAKRCAQRYFFDVLAVDFVKHVKRRPGKNGLVL